VVAARTAAPETLYVSGPVNGYSVDDLAPPVPAPPLAEPGPGATRVTLTWTPSPAPDVTHYAVYRGASAGFVPGSPAEAYATTADTVYVDPDVRIGRTWHYRLGVFDDAGHFSGYSPSVPGGSRIQSETGRWSGRRLSSAPNPFNPATTIAFAVDRAGPVSLRIYDVRGALVRTLVDGTRPPGVHEAAWDGTDDAGRPVASGTYLYELVADGRRLVEKLSLVR
jgi:hypothetical protein